MMAESPTTSIPDQVRLRKSIRGSRSSSSSLSRRSLIPQTRETNRQNEEGNDDAERPSLVASERAVATSTSHSPRRPRDTMSLSPQKEHFQGCLNIYAENKINKDNAWNLQLIDFMTSMLRKHDSRMDNLQTASTIVEASARIYSFRVDSVHFDVLRMAGRLNRAAQSKRGKKDDDGCTQDAGAAGGDAAAPTKNKKRAKRAIAANPDVLNGDFEDPFFERLAATAGDITSPNRAFNATLPINEKTLGLILRTDDRFLEPIEENIPEDLDLSEQITLPAELSPAFTDEDHICEPFNRFSVSNWDPETEDTDARVNQWFEDNHRLNLSLQALAFDVDAEVETVPQEENHNNLFDDEPLGGIENDEEDVFMAPAPPPRLTDMRPGAATESRLEYSYCGAIDAAWAVPRHGRLKNNRDDEPLGGIDIDEEDVFMAPAPPPRLTDMRPGAATESRLEYSYCGAIDAAWAVPRHGRLKNNRVSERTQTTAGRTLKSTKSCTKKQLDLLGVGLAFDSRAEPTGVYKPVQPSKIMISRKTLATGHTWDEANFKMPIDRGIDESPPRQHRVAPEPQPVPADEKSYDYNNENDASYCDNNAQDDEWGNVDGAAAAGLHAQASAAALHGQVTAAELHAQATAAEPEEIGNLLEPPAKVGKISIHGAMKAKKVDMEQLKRCTWEILTENSQEDKEEVTCTTFATIFNKLSTNMRESVSVPLALLSVLHLATEKGMILEQGDDLNDFDIVGLIQK